MAFAKLQSRILSAAEAVQAAKLHGDMPPEQQAIMLSAGGPGTGTGTRWTAMHKSAQAAQWRMATALRLGATPDAGPRSTCALRKGNDGDMCEQSLATLPVPPVVLQVRRSQDQTTRAVQCTLRRLIEQAGGYADMERHVPELYDSVKNNNEVAPTMRCAILDVVSWFPGVLQQLWIDVSVRCPHAERCNESALKPGVAAVAGEAEKTKRCGTAVRSVEGWAVRAPSYCVTWWQRRRKMVSAARMLSEDGGPNWSECC